MLDRTLQTLLVICLIPLLVGASLLMLLFPPITRFWSARFFDVQNSAVSKEEATRAAESGLRFIAGGEDDMLRGDDYQTAFSDDAIAHMRDVRAVFGLVKAVTGSSAVLVLAFSVSLFKRGRTALLSQALRLAGVSVLGITSALAFFGWLNFDALFTAMHRLLFVEGTWTFPYNSLLLIAYPFEFWAAMAINWAIILVLLCSSAIAIGRRLN